MTELHVIPIDDLREHEEAESCWCSPRLMNGVLVHNSMDDRESHEHGRKLQ